MTHIYQMDIERLEFEDEKVLVHLKGSPVRVWNFHNKSILNKDSSYIGWSPTETGMVVYLKMCTFGRNIQDIQDNVIDFIVPHIEHF